MVWLGWVDPGGFRQGQRNRWVSHEAFWVGGIRVCQDAGTVLLDDVGTAVMDIEPCCQTGTRELIHPNLEIFVCNMRETNVRPASSSALVQDGLVRD